MKTPLLILSDSPTTPTGLGRITHDLASRIHEHLGDVFRVGTFGVGSPASRHLPWPQYNVTRLENYVLPELPSVWKDFAGDEKGIVFAVWNPSWLWWLAQPGRLPESELRSFLESNPFQTWLYAPVDGDSGFGVLSREMSEIFGGFDRLLGYTDWGRMVMAKTMNEWETGDKRGLVPHHLPHGLDTNTFKPTDRAEARKAFVSEVFGGPRPAEINPEVLLLGCVATNSPRKDWYLAFEICQHIQRLGRQVGLWAHTDHLRRYWDLSLLAEQFEMKERTIFTTRNLTNEQLVTAYNACDVTLGIGSGEGWGFPLAESLACGVPVIHGNYAGGAEFVPPEFLIQPIGYRGEGLQGIRRPVFSAADWANAALLAKGRPTKLPEYIDWNNAWPAWEKWLREGIQ